MLTGHSPDGEGWDSFILDLLRPVPYPVVASLGLKSFYGDFDIMVFCLISQAVYRRKTIYGRDGA